MLAVFSSWIVITCSVAALPQDLTARAATLLITVREADGKTPFPGVHVQHRPLDVPDSYLCDRWVITDEKGDVRIRGLAAGRHELTLDRAGVTVCELGPGESKQVTLLVPRGTDVKGTVVDTDDQPVADAGVWLSSGRDGDEGEVVTRSDAKGRFGLRAVGSDRVLVAYGARVGVSGVVSVDDQNAQEVVLRLAKNARPADITGRVVDTAGRPLADARVMSGLAVFGHEPRGMKDPRRPPPRWARTDESGSFVIHGEVVRQSVDDDVRIWIGAAGFARRLFLGDIPRGGVDLGTIALEPAASLEGSVRDTGGRPIPDQLVNLHVAALRTRPGVAAQAPFWAWMNAVTDAQGAFRIDGIPETSAWIEADAQGLGEAHERLAFARGERRKVDVVVRPPLRQAGVLVDESGKPLAGIEVHAVSDYEPRTDRRATTDNEGRFTLDLAACEHAIRIVERVSALRFTQLDAFTKLTPKAEAARIVVPPSQLATASIRGIVLDERGRPLGGARLKVTRLGESGSGEHGTADAEGKFCFGPIPAGTYRVGVSAPGKWWLNRSGIVVAPGQSVEVEPLRYTSGGTLVANIKDVKGFRYVSLLDPVQMQAYVASVNDGRTELTLPSGEYLMLVRCGLASDGTTLGIEQRVEVVAGKRTELALTPAPMASRCFTFVPSADCFEYMVKVTDGQDRVVQGYRTTCTPHAEQTVRIDLLLNPGKYRLLVEDQRGRNAASSFEVADVTMPTLPVALSLR